MGKICASVILVCVSWLQILQNMTDGGADYCFECVGNVDIMLAAFRSTHEVRFWISL
jgi:Zn-dependent alcohol dehydrogenase